MTPQQLVINLLLHIIRDDETRRRLGYIIAIPIVIITLILSSFHYMLTASAAELKEIFTNEAEYAELEEALEAYGYGYNGAEIGDFSNVDAIDPEAFQRLMAEAQKYIGMTYVWGGSNPITGFDCSGYICWVYTKSRVYALPRTTAQGIFNQCVVLPREEAKAGDLVFFTGTYQTSSPVTHIGIYIGDGKMLHCGDPIGYASIDTAYWSKHFYAFGRLEAEE